jgi:hypothetical protein
LPEELRDDLTAPSAEGKAQADFALADVDIVAERSVQADASQGKSRNGKERQQDRAEAIFCKGI